MTRRDEMTTALQGLELPELNEQLMHQHLDVAERERAAAKLDTTTQMSAVAPIVLRRAHFVTRRTAVLLGAIVALVAAQSLAFANALPTPVTRVVHEANASVGLPAPKVHHAAVHHTATAVAHDDAVTHDATDDRTAAHTPGTRAGAPSTGHQAEGRDRAAEGEGAPGGADDAPGDDRGAGNEPGDDNGGVAPSGGGRPPQPGDDNSGSGGGHGADDGAARAPVPAPVVRPQPSGSAPVPPPVNPQPQPNGGGPGPSGGSGGGGTSGGSGGGSGSGGGGGGHGGGGLDG